MWKTPNPSLNETAAGLVSDSLWSLLTLHGMIGLPLARFTRSDTEDRIRVTLTSGHIIYVSFHPERPREVAAKYRARHRR